VLKLYLPESGNDEFNEMVVGRDDVLVSDLAVTEILSAVARRLHQGSLTRGVPGDSRTRFSGASMRACIAASN
jgi:hypothetical protein